MGESSPPENQVGSHSSDGPTIEPSVAELRPIIAEEPTTQTPNIRDESYKSGPSTQETNEGEDSDVFYDLSHVSHDHQNAALEKDRESPNNQAEQDTASAAIEQIGEIQSTRDAEEVVAELTEVEVWDAVDSTGKHTVTTVVAHETTSEENAIIGEEPLETIVPIPVVNDAPEDQASIEQPSNEQGPPLWIIIAALTVWCCFILVLLGTIYFLAHSINWDGIEIFTAVAIPLPSKAWLDFLHLPKGFSLTQAKEIDFVAAAILAPLSLGLANFVWFKIGRRLCPKVDAAIELEKGEAGTFNVMKLLGLVKTSKRRLVLLAILLLSSAFASTFLSNVLGYKAISSSSRENLQAQSEDHLYQIVYFPGLLLPALCTITSASTAALLLIVLQWRSVLKKKQSEQLERGEGIITDEHDVNCQSTTRAHAYVSFPRFRTGRRLFSRGGRGIFSSSRRNTSGEGEMEPLLQRTQRGGEVHASSGSWKMPSFGLPSFALRRNFGNVEETPEADGGEAPRSSSAPWKLPQISFPVWRRTQSSPMIMQHAEDQHPGEMRPQNPSSEDSTEHATSFVRQGRKFWRLPSYRTVSILPDSAIAEANMSVPLPKTADAQETNEATSEVPKIWTHDSLWRLPLPSKMWSASWRSERRNREHESASETSSLLSQVEDEDVILPRVDRTSSFWSVPSYAGHYTAPTSKVHLKEPSLSEEGTRASTSNNHVNSSESISSERIPRTGWWPSFKSPDVLVDILPRDAKRPTLLPAFKAAPPKQLSKDKTRFSTASEALNTAIGNQQTSSSSRDTGMGAPMNPISSQGYVKNIEEMTYNNPNVPGISNTGTGWSVPWIHIPLFSSQGKGKQTAETSKPIVSAQTWTEDPPLQSPDAPILSPMKKGKGPERYVDQFEATIENVHEQENPVVIHEESMAMHLTKTKGEEEADRDSTSSMGWRAWRSRPTKPQDVETGSTTQETATQSLTTGAESNDQTSRSPDNETIRNFTQSISSIPSSSREERWKGWTWWDVTWPHFVDVSTSHPPSATPSPRQISASSTISVKSKDLEAQKITPEHNTAGSNDAYTVKRPLWGLGRASYQLPQPSPVSIMLPGYLSPGPSNMSTNPAELIGASVPEIQEQGESSSKVWYGGGNQLLIESPNTSKGKEPMRDEWPWIHDH